MRGNMKAITIAAVACAALITPAAAQGGGDGTIYVGTYDNAIYVIDEATMRVSHRIQIQSGIPMRMILSHNRERFYISDPTRENVEIVDLATRRSTDRFTLSEDNTVVRIMGLNVDPTEQYAILAVRSYKKLLDRYEVGDVTLLRYDLATHTVTDTIPWPDDEPRERGARIIFSPDGDLVYFFAEDILVLETENFTEVDRWDYAEALGEGMGRFGFGFPTNFYEDPGFYTGMFRVTDPVQNRRMMGVARVNLAERDVDFYILGPSEGVSFSIAPDGKKAYGLRQRVGDYQFWTFDLENRRVEGKTQFKGRPRMALIPSSNGQFLYIYNAGNTIDIYEADTKNFVRTVELDADMTRFVLVPAGGR